MKFILGRKIGMSQVFGQQGQVIPVTLIAAGPVFVTQLKSKEQDGYEAIQVGFDKISKQKKIKKSQQTKPYRFLREFRVSRDPIPATTYTGIKVADRVGVEIFKEGDKVKISGISKGKGFQGGVKRWGFRGLPASHGVKHEHRTIGSTGSRFPQRVLPGKKMPGHMGAERVTLRNLEVVRVDPEKNLLAVKGAVPGRRGTLLEIKS